VRRSTIDFLLVHWMALVLLGAFIAAAPMEAVGSEQQACLLDEESPGPGPSLHKLAEGTFACAAELVVRDEPAPPIVGNIHLLACREHHAGGTNLQAAGIRLQV
jgi:hypothetical protein